MPPRQLAPWITCFALASGCTADSSSDASSDSGEETDSSDTDSPAVGFVTVVSAGPEDGAFSSVWGIAPDDVWAVGGQRDPDAMISTGLIYRRDGEGWGEASIPDGMPMLNWVFGVDEIVWMVGLSGGIWSFAEGEFTEHESGTDRVLWGIWGTGAEQMWAVGGNAIDDDPVLLSWDGATWNAVDLPELEGHGLLKIWGTGESDVMAVGDQGIAIHFDGTSWTSVETGSNADLISLWGTGPDEILAVGGRADGRLGRFDGEVFVGETVDAPGLAGTWMDADGVATVVGSQGTAARVAKGTFELEFEETDTPLLLHAVYGFDSGLRIAVGGTLSAAPPFVGVILESEP